MFYKVNIQFYNYIMFSLLFFIDRVSFLHADGEVFTHPLAHLTKTPADLPVIAIDSFRHMYLFPDPQQLDNPDALEKFIEDLYSGKLHREYHYGPEIVSVEDNLTMSTKIPESAFKKLQPSQHRYTLVVKDEL